MEKTSNIYITKMHYIAGLWFICALAAAGTFVFLELTKTCVKTSVTRHLANNVTETVTKENCTNFGY
jgi:hypothetical protein